MNKQNKWGLYLIGVVSVILIITAIIKVITPQEAEIKITSLVNQNPDQTTTNFSKIIFEGTQSFESGSKAKFSIYSYTKLEDNFDKINQIIDDYNLSPAKGISDAWLSEKYSLNFFEDENQFILVKNRMPQDLPKLTLESAELITNNFIKKYFGDLGIEIEQNHIQYLSSTLHFNQVSSQEATQIVIPYSYKINGIPLIENNKTSFPFVFIVNGNKEIQKLTMSPLYIKLVDLNLNKNAISINQAIENINNNKASLIDYESNKIVLQDTSELVSGTMSSVSLEYRLDPENGLIYPFYRFKGVAQNKDQTQLNVEIITPAVETTP